MNPKPERFEQRDAENPAPTKYYPKYSNQMKHRPGHIKSKSIRFLKNKFDTETPGPGTYRDQPSFGIYCANDTNNRVNSDLLMKIYKS